MAAEQTRWALRRIDRLFQGGCVTGLDDARLLERFAADRDELTLEALIERHGPMVLGVCRRVLVNPADVDDAFQATFLILVRKAPALRDVHRLGPWLHGVAYRVAARARSDAYRRRLREQQGARSDRDPETHSPDRLAVQAELREAIDREIGRLSASHRAAIVLCDLEGRSSQDAARLLGWSEDALRGRLARARQKLRQRLERRNLAPIVLPGIPAIPSLPAPLIETTTRASMATVLAGRAAPSAVGAISASVSTLAHGVIQTMLLSRMKRLAAGLVLAAIGLLVATGLVRAGLPGSPAASSPAKRIENQAPGTNTGVSAPRPLELRVVARQGKQPIAGATVEATTIVEGSYRESKFTTDAQGRCKLILPGGGPLAMLSIAKDGFVPFYHAWGDEDPAPAEAITQELEPGQPIGGFVRDEHGQPIAAADVTVAIGPIGPGGLGEIPDVDVPTPGNFQVYAGYPHLQVKTDAQGRWQCSILPANPERGSRLWFYVEHPDHVSDTGGYSRRLSLATARAMTGSLIMSQGVEVRGEVRDGADRPVTGARVVLAYSASSGHLLSTKTDDQGRFRFAHANDKNGLRRWVVSVQAAGFAPAWQPVGLTAPIPPVSLRVTPSKPFHGRVVDAKGKPIAGASVGVSWQECQHLDWKGFTDADGRFAWSDGPLDGEIFFSAGKQGYVSVYHHRIAAEAGETTITLNPPMRVHGTVVDAETGQPIPSFQVLEGESSQRSPIFWRRQSGQVFTGGRFDASPFHVEYPGTTYFLRAEADGYVPATSRGITFGEPEITLAFRLRKGSGPSGFVRTSDGKPAVGADVYLTNPKYGLPLHNNVHEPPPAREFWTRTDDKGHFSFGAKDEPYGVLVVHPQGVAQKTPEDLALSSGMTLEPYGRIEGTLRIGNELGKRQPIHVRLERSAHPSDPWLFIQYAAMTDDQGHFAIDRVMPGEAAVYRSSSVNGIEVRLSSAPLIDVVSGQVARVEIGGRGRPVTGRVSLPGNSATRINLAQATGILIVDKVTLPQPEDIESWDWARQCAWSRSPEGKAWRSAHHVYDFPIDADGHFRIEDVLPGAYELRVSYQSTPGFQGPAAGQNQVTGRVERKLTIDPIPGDRTDVPIDLGTVEMKINAANRR